MYTLIKDFEYMQITFYWLNKQSERISPSLRSIEHAKEWIHDHHFSLYTGPERRTSKIDRRKIDSKEELNTRRNYLSYGRRVTDKPIRVDINLASQKIAEITGNKILEPA